MPRGEKSCHRVRVSIYKGGGSRGEGKGALLSKGGIAWNTQFQSSVVLYKYNVPLGLSEKQFVPPFKSCLASDITEMCKYTGSPYRVTPPLERLFSTEYSRGGSRNF